MLSISGHVRADILSALRLHGTVKTLDNARARSHYRNSQAQKKIVDLDICPLDLFRENDREAIREQCISRGQKWKELCQSPTAIPRDCDTPCLHLMAERQGYWDPFEGEEKRSEPLETRVWISSE